MHINNLSALSHLALAILNTTTSVSETLKTFLADLEGGVFEDIMKSTSKEEATSDDNEFTFWQRCEELTDPVRYRVWDVSILLFVHSPFTQKLHINTCWTAYIRHCKTI